MAPIALTVLIALVDQFSLKGGMHILPLSSLLAFALAEPAFIPLPRCRAESEVIRGVER